MGGGTFAELVFRLIKPLLFLLPPETAHNFVFSVLRVPLFRAMVRQQVKDDPIELFGLHFRNRTGVAAGLDKNGKHLKALAAMGFGHIEVGTVTPRPQPGNPKPRVFRLPRDKALINRMGFPGEGAEVVARRLQKQPAGVVIGINIGKNKETPLEKAEEDYATCFEKLFDVADYFTVNVSSPNTPGLRELQEREPLTRILTSIQSANRGKSHPKPILLKVSPDLTSDQVRDVIEVARSTGISGFVATNTTVSREGLLRTSAARIQGVGEGGLSGPPLHPRALDVVRLLSPSGLPVIACGGISSHADAKAAFDAGASLVQVYTGLIYEGPKLVRLLSAT